MNAKMQAWVDNLEKLGPEYKAAVEDYAIRHGGSWIEDLADDFYHGRDEREQDSKGNHVGHLMRQIRNHPVHGIGFYRALNNEAEHV